jgi:hypothetical protein
MSALFCVVLVSHQMSINDSLSLINVVLRLDRGPSL